MKALKSIFPFVAILTFGIFISSCGSKQDAATYNNKLMTLMNKNERDMRAMNAGMTADNYQQVETIRKTWENNLSDELKEANSLKRFRGNDDFKTAIVKGLKSYQKIVTDDYKQLIAIRSKADITQKAKEDNLLSNINNVLEQTASTANKASSDFEAKFAN